MVYAEGLACWSEEEEMLRRLVTSFAKSFREVVLKMNVGNTVIMNLDE